jgi:hypothetical protein
MTTVIDEKLKAYGALQQGMALRFYRHYALLLMTVFCLATDTQNLFSTKQQVLSQFNENTLVKGVCSIYVD